MDIGGTLHVLRRQGACRKGSALRVQHAYPRHDVPCQREVEGPAAQPPPPVHKYVLLPQGGQLEAGFAGRCHDAIPKDNLGGVRVRKPLLITRINDPDCVLPAFVPGRRTMNY